MSNFLMLAMCLAAGMLLRRSGRAPHDAHVAINAVIIHVSLPAVTLRYLHGFDFSTTHLLPVLMPWILFALGAVLFWILGQWLALPRRSVGALTLVGGLGNTSFVGLPMIESLYGREGLGLGLLIDQLGSYLVLSTVGMVAVAVYTSEGHTSVLAVVRKVATFPPFIALTAALVLTPISFAPAVDAALARIGETLAPLALLSVGMQLQFDALLKNARLLGLGLGYKLLLCPAMVIALLWLHNAEPLMASHVSVIEAAMPPMIGAGIVATQAGLDPPLVSAMIGIGIPLGLLTAIAWHQLFGWAVA